MSRLQGKVAIITGAAGGQGAAEAKLFAKEGAKVVATDWNDELLHKTVKEINDEIGSEVVIGLKHNVADEENWKQVVEATLEKFGKIDILVNNAGIGGKAPIIGEDGKPRPSVLDYTVQDFKDLMDVNTTGNFIGLKYVTPHMVEQKKGSIINVSSIAGLIGGQANIAYHSSKGATRIMAKAAAIELAPYGVRVNSVHPGGVKTPMLINAAGGEEVLDQLAKAVVPLQYISEAIELAYVVLFLASDESSYVTGAEIVADGGVTAQ